VSARSRCSADLLDRARRHGALSAAPPTRWARPLTILVNNASIFEHDTLASATDESWDRHIGSNLRAPFELTQAFAAQAPGRPRCARRAAGPKAERRQHHRPAGPEAHARPS
jgi:NAD(P)-dependent dehydrogenase (short-subunit alcohol dehydrogenase family)